MQSALQNSGIVPDVIDTVDLEHAVKVTIKYPKHTVANGNLIPKEDVRFRSSHHLTLVLALTSSRY